MADTQNYFIDSLKERTTGKKLYPQTLLEAVKISAKEDSETLMQLLEKQGFFTDYELYGYKIDRKDPNPQTRVSYFEMASGKRPAFWNYTNGYFDEGDWAHAFFMKNSFPCMVKDDGTMDYKLDPNNYLLKIDGTSSDITNTEYLGSAMVAFPTIWIKRWQDENYLYCLITDKKPEDDEKNEFHAYMHTREDGTVAEYKYIAMYMPTLYTNKYRALSGTTVTASNTFEDELRYASNIGKGWGLFSVSDWATLNDLLTLISKSDNFQQSFGYGYVGASALNTSSDGGAIYYGGPFYNSAALATNSWQKVFHLHNLYGNHMTRLAGIVYDTGALKIKPYPPYNITGEEYIDLEITLTGTSDAYINDSKMTEYGRFPISTGGSETTYECDAVEYSNTVLAIGATRGLYNKKALSGKMGFSLLNPSTYAHANVAPRITFIPDLPEIEVEDEATVVAPEYGGE